MTTLLSAPANIVGTECNVLRNLQIEVRCGLPQFLHRSVDDLHSIRSGKDASQGRKNPVNHRKTVPHGFHNHRT
jgi:hypothetical protein